MFPPRHLSRHGSGLIQLHSGPRPPLPLVLGVISLSSSSSAPSTSRQSYSTVANQRFKPDLKGKGKAIDISYPVCLGSRRAFHATARRHAIPLLPATIAVLKVSQCDCHVEMSNNKRLVRAPQSLRWRPLSHASSYPFFL